MWTKKQYDSTAQRIGGIHYTTADSGINKDYIDIEE